MFAWFLISLAFSIPAYGNSADSIAFQVETDTLLYRQSPLFATTEHKTAGDILRETPGVFLRTSAPGGTQTVSAQGLNPQHIQILWNDIPVNSGMLGVSDLSLFTVGYRQEVSYSIQGQEFATGGLAGVVNIKDGFSREEGFSLGIKQSAGSFGQSLTHLHHQGAAGSHLWSISGGYERAKNAFPYNDYTVYPNVTKRQKNGSYSKWHFYPKWQMKLKKGSVLNFYQEIISNSRNVPPFLVSPNNLAHQKDIAARQMWSWSYKHGKTAHLIKGLFSYNNLQYEDFILNRKDNNREYLAYFRYKGTLFITPKWHWKYGSDIKSTHIKTDNYKQVIQETGWDAHTGAVFKPTPFSSLTGQVKLTKRSHLSWHVPYQLEAFVYTGNKKLWKLWTRHGMDVRYPTLNDRFWTPGGNTALSPEKNISVSTGASGSIFFSKNLIWKQEFEVFYNKLRDMILWLPTNKGYFEPDNIGKVLAYGFHIRESLHWSKAFHSIDLQTSYGLNRSGNTEKRFQNDKSQWVQLPYFPVHSGKILFNYSWKQLSLSMDSQAYSERLVTRDRGTVIAPYALLNSTISYSHKIKNIDIEGRFSLNNLLDTEYEEVRFRPMPKRNYLFTFLITLNYEKN